MPETDGALMAHRPFVMFPNPVLKARATEVDGITDTVRAIWDEMLLAMYAMPGVGLAAPQLGIGLRLAVIDCSPSKDQPILLANPEILWTSDVMSSFEEGSPNLPGTSAWVDRPDKVTVRFVNDAGETAQRTFEDLWATSVQHQIDHLDGKLYFDHLSSLKRRRLLEAHRKKRRGKGNR